MLFLNKAEQIRHHMCYLQAFCCLVILCPCKLIPIWQQAKELITRGVWCTVFLPNLYSMLTATGRGPSKQQLQGTKVPESSSGVIQHGFA